MTDMVILGIHRDPWHNTGAAMIKDDGSGPQYAMVSEERLDRIKDSRGFPEKSIRACMKELGIASLSEIDAVVFDYIQNSDWKNDHFKQKSVQGTFLDEIDPKKIHVINHHLAHACSTFYSSSFEKSAILIVDGRGSELETQSLFVGDGDGIQLIASTKQIGIGLMYAAVTQAIGFGLLQEGKTMGLAPYGRDHKKKIFDIPARFDGILTDYSSFCVDGSYEIQQKHAPITTFEDKARGAFEAQEACEKAMLYLAKYAKEATQQNNLCLSGGVALNSVANYKIHQTGLFEDIFINPACSDTGIPLGCAMYGYHILNKKPQIRHELTAFLGPSYSEQEIENAVKQSKNCKVISENSLSLAAELLSENKIVSVFQGRSEMGPRALGNRSILMSPLKAENKDIINARVKHREAFRPFAPVVLLEHMQDYFEMDKPCPFMLMVPYVRPEMRKVIPAVTHVDGTGRLQTVTEKENKVFYGIISQFKERTGVPVILNSSFNDNGEPIVESPQDAINCFMKTNIDALFIGKYLLIKQ